MRYVVLGVVAVVAVLLLDLGPATVGPLAQVLLVLCAIAAGIVPAAADVPPGEAPSAGGSSASGVGDEPGPLRP